MTCNALLILINKSLICLNLVAPTMHKKQKTTADVCDKASEVLRQMDEYGEQVMSVNQRNTTAMVAIDAGTK